MTKEPKFHEPTWHWATKDYDLMNGYMHMEGRHTIRALLDHLAEVAPGYSVEDFGINFGTVTWSRPPTADELAHLAEWQRKHAARQDEWERKTLVRLLKKYGVPQTYGAERTCAPSGTDGGRT